MNEEPKNIWKKSWKGPRAFLLWLLIVSIASFLAAVITAITAISARLFDRHAGFRNFAGWTLEVMVGFFIAVAIMFVFYKIVRWLFCWRNFRWFLFGCACFATLIALFYAEEDWRGWHAWQKFKHQWEARGERFDLASVIPPTVPDDQNFALTPIWVESMKAVLGPKNSRQWFGNNYDENGRTNFTDRLQMEIYHTQGWSQSQMEKIQVGNWQRGEMTDLKLWQNYYRSPSDGVSPIVLTNDFPVAPQLQSPAQDVLVALSKYDSAIEELRQASRLPYSRFPLNYDSEFPGAILLPHLATMKHCSQVLQLRAIAELQNGQSDKALDDVKLMLQLTDPIHTEPFLISHLVRIAIVNLALQPVWEGLAEHKWSDAQLVELDQELAKLDFLADYKVGVRGEMVLCQIGNIEYLRRLPEQAPNLVGGGNSSPPALARIVWRLIPNGWFYQNELRCARMMLEQCLPVADTERRIVSPAAVDRAGAAAEAGHRNPYNILERMLLPAFGAASKRFANEQNAVDMARVACALERYRLTHGGYPESLDALAPQFIAKLPHDIINGQPLHYRHTSDPSSQSSGAASGQFVLYSVGWNETDDGGEVDLDGPFGKSGNVNINKGDWVWQYPSK
jgi:hypothetical protein